MTNLLNFLSGTRVLICTFVLMVICGASFGLYIEGAGGTMLDMLWDESAALNTLGTMSPPQKDTHFWITVLLDSLYPLFYGAFFIGMIARLAQEHSSWAVWPSIIGVDADFVENFVQAIALSGNTDLLFLKDFVTPLKFAGLAISLLLIIIFGIKHLMAKRSSET